MLEFLTSDVVEAFWQRVEQRGPDECWLWNGSRGDWGYGRLWLNGSRRKYLPAHRVAYVLTYGELPEGKLLVCHSCDNPPCCNPAHLFAGSNLDNARDKAAKGRWKGNLSRGEDAPGAKLGESQVMEIRRLYAETTITFQEIGRTFNIDPSAACQIVYGKHWAHLPLVPIPQWKKALARKRPGNGPKPGERLGQNLALSPEQVAEMRTTYAAGGITQGALAQRYGVTRQTAHFVIKRKGAYRD